MDEGYFVLLRDCSMEGAEPVSTAVEVTRNHAEPFGRPFKSKHAPPRPYCQSQQVSLPTASMTPMGAISARTGRLQDVSLRRRT